MKGDAIGQITQSFTADQLQKGLSTPALLSASDAYIVGEGRSETSRCPRFGCCDAYVLLLLGMLGQSLKGARRPRRDSA